MARENDNKHGGIGESKEEVPVVETNRKRRGAGSIGGGLELLSISATEEEEDPAYGNLLKRTRV